MPDTSNGFYTMKGYMLLSPGEMTSAMEDYLEMIVRRQADSEPVRAVDLADRLHVKASSVSKMIQQLANAGLVQTRKYGVISLTDKGKSVGNYLLYRHDVLNRFLCLINDSASELEQVEKIEHFINEKTVKNLEKFVNGYIDKK